jgi:hypothetical protein
VPERYWVERAPGYVRLRQQLALQGRLKAATPWPDHDLELGSLTTDDELLALLGAGRHQLPDWDDGPACVTDPPTNLMFEDRRVRVLGRDGLPDGPRGGETGTPPARSEPGDHRPGRRRAAAANRAGRGAGGISAWSRAELWRKVLSLPFEMLGDRPLWVTLTYPRVWRVRVRDGRALEGHRRAFGERWRRNFGEPIGFWTKEFQLAEGRPTCTCR